LSNDKGSESSIFTTPIDYSENNSVSISFFFQVKGNVLNEYFLFEVSNDGGATYNEVKRWVYDSDFDLDVWTFESVIIQKANLTKNTSFRIRSNFSSFLDKLFIDDIKIELCHPLGTTGETEGDFTVVTIEEELNVNNIETETINITKSVKADNSLYSNNNRVKNLETIIKLYPNPATEWLTIDLGTTDGFSIDIISNSGLTVFQSATISKTKETFDINHIPSNQLYMVVIKQSNKPPEIRRFFKF